MNARSKRNQGFTIVEVMVVVAILGIAVAVAVPSFNGMVRQSQVDSLVRQLRNDIGIARTAAAPRDVMASSGTRVSASGIRIQDAQTYQLFTDDRQDGTPPANEEVVRTVTLDSNLIRIVQPNALPAEIVFKSSGVLQRGATNQVMLLDPVSGRRYPLEISMTGNVRQTE